MAHLIENNIVAVFLSEIVDTGQCSADNARQLVARGKLKKINRACFGSPVLYDYDTLPIKVKELINDPRHEKHQFEKYYRKSAEVVRFFASYQFENGTYLPVEHQERYKINAYVIEAALAFRGDLVKERQNKGLNLFGIDEVLRKHTISFKKTLETKHGYTHTLPEGEKAFKKALKEFEKYGYESLVSGKHGNNNSRKVTDKTLALLEIMFAADPTKPTTTEVHRRYIEFIFGKLEVIDTSTGEMFIPGDFDQLSDSTIKKYLTSWQSAAGTYAARSGDRQKLMGQFKPYHTLEQPKFAGSIISIDDRQPPFKMPDGKRPWFYNGIDLASEAFVCWVFGQTKEGIILEFYRQLVRNYAEWGLCLPAELECEMSLNSQYQNTFLREGAMFEFVRIEANNARGKRIERYYGQLRYGLEKKREGWLARPFALSESNQAGSHEVKTLYYDEIIEGCLRDIETWNNMPHSKHTDLTRWEVFMQMQHPDLKPINYKAFLFHLGRKTPTSCGFNGIIKFRSSEFLLGQDGVICVGDPLIDLMDRAAGKDIDIYWLDGNDRSILKALIYISDLLICEAVPKPTYNRARKEQTPEDLKNRELMSKYEATIRAYAKRRKQAITTVIFIDKTEPRKKSFVMPGLRRAPMINGSAEVEILPDLPGEFEVINEPITRKSLKDRF
ncbi:MAG TPA: hypothetical protein VHE59_10460 [Mucilaginibacter sp.]|nr:hypothetical protein [Mucilaginibacter sp.]